MRRNRAQENTDATGARQLPDKIAKFNTRATESMPQRSMRQETNRISTARAREDETTPVRSALQEADRLYNLDTRKLQIRINSKTSSKPSDKTRSNTFKIPATSSHPELLGGSSGSILSTENLPLFAPRFTSKITTPCTSRKVLKQLLLHSQDREPNSPSGSGATKCIPELDIFATMNNHDNLLGIQVSRLGTQDTQSKRDAQPG